MSSSTGTGPVSDDAMAPLVCSGSFLLSLGMAFVLLLLSRPESTSWMGRPPGILLVAKFASIHFRPDIFKTAASVPFGKAPRFLLDPFLEVSPRIWTFHTAQGASDDLHPGWAVRRVSSFFCNDLLASTALSHTGVRVSRSANSGCPHSYGLDGIRSDVGIAHTLFVSVGLPNH